MSKSKKDYRTYVIATAQPTENTLTKSIGWVVVSTPKQSRLPSKRMSKKVFGFQTVDLRHISNSKGIRAKPILCKR